MSEQAGKRAQGFLEGVLEVAARVGVSEEVRETMTSPLRKRIEGLQGAKSVPNELACIEGDARRLQEMLAAYLPPQGSLGNAGLLERAAALLEDTQREVRAMQEGAYRHYAEQRYFVMRGAVKAVGEMSEQRSPLPEIRAAHEARLRCAFAHLVELRANHIQVMASHGLFGFTHGAASLVVKEEGFMSYLLLDALGVQRMEQDKLHTFLCEVLWGER